MESKLKINELDYAISGGLLCSQVSFCGVFIGVLLAKANISKFLTSDKLVITKQFVC